MQPLSERADLIRYRLIFIYLKKESDSQQKGEMTVKCGFFYYLFPAGAGIAAERKNEFMGFLGTPLVGLGGQFTV